MKKLVLLSLILVLRANSDFLLAQQNNLRHALEITFNIKESTLSVIDTLNFTAKPSAKITFRLNKNLEISSSSCKYNKVEDTENTSIYNEYLLHASSNICIVEYSGIIEDGKEAISHPKHGQSSSTSGIIFDKGIYLSGSTYWVPRFDDFLLVTYSMNTTVDKTWSIVTQGDKIADSINQDKRTMRFVSNNPTNQIYLTANQWSYTSRKYKDIDIEAYLITKDEAIAQKYIGATSSYLKMYEETIGPYPYSKFALIENFWESGLGMPSFTLLGQRVIRMPWIIGSSYPHELLHNYWGNSVFVDYSSGNWSEGITVYMADHHFKEVKGEGASYRSTALKNYTDYVSEENDFPLNEFTVRTTNASSAIGYDKAMMVNHMLKVKYGEKAFYKAYAHFYEHNKFKRASFNSIKESFETTTGDELDYFFNQWVNKTGAPHLTIESISTKGKNLSFTINQTQKGDLFALHIPIALVYQDTTLYTSIENDKQSESYKIKIAKGLKEVRFDPNFDVMRLLDTKETAASFANFISARKLTMVVPTKGEHAEAYKQFANEYKMTKMRRGIMVNVIDDTEIEKLKQAETIMIFGQDNAALEAEQFATMYKGCIDNDNFKATKQTTSYITKEENKVVIFYNTEKPESITEQLSTMSHYGSFSCLHFDADGKVIHKSVFPITDSPMSHQF